MMHVSLVRDGSEETAMSLVGKAAGGWRARDHSPGADVRKCALESASRRRVDARPGHRRVVVAVDDSLGSAALFLHAASQARQRSATLDVVYVLPVGTDERAATMARVRLGEFTRRVCPYGVGTPVRLVVERGDPQEVLFLAGVDAELIVTESPAPLDTVSGPEVTQPAPVARSGISARALAALSAHGRSAGDHSIAA
jgi:Universal stress protein family